MPIRGPNPTPIDSDRINAVLAAAGYNFGLLLRWLAELLRAIIRAFAETVPAQRSLKSAVVRVLHGGLHGCRLSAVKPLPSPVAA
jgi:hypothetical protein